MEQVAQWSAKRKLWHAQMLNRYHEYRNEQTNAQTAQHEQFEYDGQQANQQMPTPSPDQMPSPEQSHSAQMPSQPQTTQSPSGPSGASHPATARHENSYDIANEDVDWQYCSQCRGLFEPGEYEEHFDMPDFDCDEALEESAE